MSADVLVLAIVFGSAYFIRTQIDHRALLHAVYVWEYFLSFLIIAPIWIIVYASLGLYSSGVYERRLVEWSRIVLGTFLGILLIIGWEYATRLHVFPARLVTAYVLAGSTIAVILAREAVRQIRHELYRYGVGVSRTLVVGNSPATKDIITEISSTSRSGFQVVAYAGPEKYLPAHLGIKRYSKVESAMNDIKKLHINTIIQTDLYDSQDRNQQILGAAQINHIQYNFIPGEPEFYAGKNTVDVFLGYPMITVSQTPLVGWGAVAKSVFDFIVSIILLILLSPIFIIIIILQKIFNPGPIFYRHTRLSRFSQAVEILKFRSMRDRPTAHLEASEEFRLMGREDLAIEYEQNRKVENDPRISKFGAFLRKTSIDELPQLINVLKGELSLVGPRPIMPQEVNFSKSRTALLHSVKSGVTGLWQVSGRSELSFDERIELELYYAQNWSFWLDLRILFKTIPAVFRKRGAK